MSTTTLPAHLFVRQEPRTGGVSAIGYSVCVETGPDAGVVRVIEGVLTVGTHPDAGLRLSDSTVSRFHLELRAEPEGIRVKDLGSSNGTFAAGARVTELLVPRDATFTAGTTRLRVTCEVTTLPDLAERWAPGEPLVGSSPPWRQLLKSLGRVAASDATVLLLGETGSGKERVARALHQGSSRGRGPFEILDCRTLGSGVIESELFGHVAGAFTDAVKDRPGAFVRADGGTLLLDGVGEMPLELQARLLRALESRKVKPVGGEVEVPFDVRIIATSDRELEADLTEGRFRRDLYFRLAVVLVNIPPLRDRREDIPVLARHFAAELGAPDFEASADTLARWSRHPWTGNLRELRNAVARLIAGGPDPVAAGREGAARRPGHKGTFKEAKEALVEKFSREYVQELLERHRGNIGAAAKEAGLARTYLYTLMKKLGLE